MNKKVIIGLAAGLVSAAAATVIAITCRKADKNEVEVETAVE